VKICDYKDYQISSLVIKASDYCNLWCDYCYQKERNINKSIHIDFELIRKILFDYFSYVEKKLLNEELYIVWHGGEPLICGVDFYKEVVKIEREICAFRPKRKIYNSIQTNGTLLSDEYLDFFKENNFGIGISIDGIPEHHNLKRHFENNKGSAKIIQNNIFKLKSYGMNFTSICVISKHALGHSHEYYNYFKKIGVSEVDFIPSFFQKSNENLSYEEYFFFLKDLFDNYYNDPFKNFGIRVFDDILRAILKSKDIYYGSIGCEYAGRCGENISISINGDIYPCDCLTTSTKFRLGNIYKNELDEILSNNNTKFLEFQSMVNDVKNECLSCEVFHVCKAGCFNRRVQNLDNYELDIDIYCKTRKNIIKYIGECCNVRFHGKNQQFGYR